MLFDRLSTVWSALSTVDFNTHTCINLVNWQRYALCLVPLPLSVLTVCRAERTLYGTCRWKEQMHGRLSGTIRHGRRNRNHTITRCSEGRDMLRTVLTPVSIRGTRSLLELLTVSEQVDSVLWEIPLWRGSWYRVGATAATASLRFLQWWALPIVAALCCSRAPCAQRCLFSFSSPKKLIGRPASLSRRGTLASVRPACLSRLIVGGFT